MLSGNAPQGVHLQVTETAGIQRVQAPVVAGVPLPPNSGVLDAAAFDLLNSSGESIAFGSRVLARWNRPVDDLSAPIKWLALTFATDLRPLSKAAFDLVPNSAAVPSANIAWADPDGIHVDTGALGFRIPHEGGSLLENLRIDMNGDQRLDVRLIGKRNAELMLPAAGGLEAASIHARLLSEGPAEAVIRLQAQPADSATGRRLIWLHAYRNQPWLRAVIQTCGVPTNDNLRLRLPIETLGDPLRASLGMSRGNTDHDWLPGESFPLGARSVAQISRHGTAADWSAQLDGQTFWTDESPSWAQVGALGWSVAVGSAPGTDDRIREISLSGGGDITIDIAAGGGCSTAELFLQFRAGRGGDIREFLTFSNPIVATAEASWYQNSLGLGPIGLSVAGADVAGDSTAGNDDWDPTFELLANWLGSEGGEATWLQAAAGRVGIGADRGFGTQIRGPLLYFWLTGDRRVEEALAAAATELLRNDGRTGSPRLPHAHLSMWESGGNAAHLLAAQAGLRNAAIGLHAAGCGADLSNAGLVLEALGRYAWARRLMQRPDRQAEQALHQLLDRMLSCRVGSSLVDGFAYGALLTEDVGQRSAYLQAAEGAVRSVTPPGSLGDSSGSHRRADRTYAWLRDRLGQAPARRGQ